MINHREVDDTAREILAPETDTVVTEVGGSGGKKRRKSRKVRKSRKEKKPKKRKTLKKRKPIFVRSFCRRGRR
tara:strand:- start:1567 stop:1785 length:219 start_codon:yes stop_codon:yes gene_type:complete